MYLAHHELESNSIVIVNTFPYLQAHNVPLQMSRSGSVLSVSGVGRWIDRGLSKLMGGPEQPPQSGPGSSGSTQSEMDPYVAKSRHRRNTSDQHLGSDTPKVSQDLVDIITKITRIMTVLVDNASEHNNHDGNDDDNDDDNENDNDSHSDNSEDRCANLFARYLLSLYRETRTGQIFIYLVHAVLPCTCA